MALPSLRPKTALNASLAGSRHGRWSRQGDGDAGRHDSKALSDDPRSALPYDSLRLDRSARLRARVAMRGHFRSERRDLAKPDPARPEELPCMSQRRERFAAAALQGCFYVTRLARLAGGSKSFRSDSFQTSGGWADASQRDSKHGFRCCQDGEGRESVGRVDREASAAVLSRTVHRDRPRVLVPSPLHAKMELV